MRSLFFVMRAWRAFVALRAFSSDASASTALRSLVA